MDQKGFDDSSMTGWSMTTNIRYNLTTKFGDSKFNDMPRYLGESKDCIVLKGILAKTFPLTEIETFGYRTLRIWTCARLYPKIYNPVAFASWVGENNPYTDISWYGRDKYDYDDMNIVVKKIGVPYENQCLSTNVQKVGLFWNLGYTDVIIPVTRNGNYNIRISRGSNINAYDMEICDVKIEML